MVLLPSIWIIGAPFLTAGVVAQSPRANALAARRLAWTLALGWLGVALLVSGAFVGSGPGVLMAAVGAPLAGLSFWMRAPGRGGDDEPPVGPEPPRDTVDWDRFFADLEDW